MDSDTDDPETEAYFQDFMRNKIHGKEAIRVMMDPEFFEFLESKCLMHTREYVADRIYENIVKRSKGFPGSVQRLKEGYEKFKALYVGIEGLERFEFLRFWFCSQRMIDEEEDERGDVSGGEKAEEEDEKSEAQGQKVWEWTESDSEAEHASVDGFVARKGNGTSSAEVETVWEWTDYDSEAEREEAERRRRRDAGTD